MQLIDQASSNNPNKKERTIAQWIIRLLKLYLWFFAFFVGFVMGGEEINSKRFWRFFLFSIFYFIFIAFLITVKKLGPKK